MTFWQITFLVLYGVSTVGGLVHLSKGNTPVKYVQTTHGEVGLKTLLSTALGVVLFLLAIGVL